MMIPNTKLISLGNNRFAIVDADLYDGLMKYKWRAVQGQRCWYAKTTVGKGDNQCELSMHRLIMRTPRAQQCHHRNRNSLDNRRRNLVNMTRGDHMAEHRINTLRIQYAQPDSQQPPAA